MEINEHQDAAAAGLCLEDIQTGSSREMWAGYMQAFVESGQVVGAAVPEATIAVFGINAAR